MFLLKVAIKCGSDTLAKGCSFFLSFFLSFSPKNGLWYVMHLSPWKKKKNFRGSVLQMKLDTVGRIPTILNKGDNFCDFLFAFLRTDPFWKRVYSKRKEFAPKGSKFLPFIVDHFQKGVKTILKKLLVLKLTTIFLGTSDILILYCMWFMKLVFL